jgi:tape measure domain-containing protein
MAIPRIGIELSLDGADKTARGVRQVAGELDVLGSAGSAATNSLRNFASVAAAGLSVQSFVQAADAVTVLNNQLKLATGSTKAAGQAFDALFAIAQRSRVSFTELGGTFASIARAGDALGLSQQRLLGVTEAISNAVAISGGSAESARASLVQLSQGLASGALRGDELNSVMEQTPRLAKALADGLGVTTGELRKLGEEGKITADKVIKALESQASALKGELAGSIVTVAQAWTQLTNASVKAAGDIDGVTGASNTLVGALQGLAGAVSTVGQAFKDNQSAINTTMGALGGAALAAGLLTVGANIGKIRLAVLGLNAALAANPVGLALVAAAAAGGALYAAFDEYEQSIDGIKGKIAELQRQNALAANDPSDAVLNANVKKRTAEIVKLTAALNALQDAERGKGGGAGRGSINPDYVKPASVEEPDKKALTAYNAELKKQVDLLATLSGVNADYDESLTRLQAIRARGLVTEKQYVELVTTLINKQPGVRAGIEAQAEAVKEFAKTQAEAARAAAEYQKAQDAIFNDLAKDLESITKSNEALALQNETIGLSTDALNALVLSRQDAAIAALEMTIADQAADNAMGLANDTLQVQIDLLQQLKRQRGLTAENQTKTAAADAIKATAAEARRLGDQLEGIISDGLMRGFESGKGFAENFRDTLENVFKTMVLRPVVQATVAGGLSAVGLPAAAQGAGGASSIFSAGSAFASSSFGLGLQGTIATIAEQGFISGFGSAMTSASTLASAGSFTGAVGAALPYVGAAIAAVAVLDKLFSKGEYVSGKTSNLTFDAQGNQTGRSVRDAFNVNDGGADTDAVVKGIVGNYFSAAQRLGIQAKGINVGFETTTAGTFGVGATVGGQQIFDSGETKYSQEAMGLAASRAVFAALQSSELPGYLSKAFTGIVANTASSEQINGALAFAESLKSIRFGLLDATAQQAEYQKIIDASTALLGTSAATFRTDFIAAIDEGLTPEGLAQWSALGSTMQALEQITGKTNETLRTAADIANERKNLEERYAQATLSTEQLAIRAREAIDGSNRARFDEVIAAEAAKTATEKLKQEQEDLANAAKAAADALKATNDSLQDRLDVLTGAQTDRGLQLRDATDATTKALLNQIFAQEDLRAATEKAAQAAQQAIDKARGQQQSISQRYASPLTEQSAAALLPPDIAAQIGTVSGKAIRDTVFDYVNALDPLSASGQAALTALEKMTPALDFFAQEADRVLAERQGLQQQLDELTISSTAKLENQRNALDESNRALFDQVQAQLAIKSASEEAARSLESFKSAMASLSTQRGNLQVQLLTAQGRPAEALALKRRADLDVLLEGRTGLDAERLKASFNANIALEDEIERTNQAAEAARAMAAAQADAARAAEQAAEQLKSAWQSATDSIFDEVRRIRALTGAGSAQTYAQAQANFSIAAVQASTGDRKAAEALPELSRVLLELAEANASSINQLRAIQGTTAGTLEGIAKQFVGQFGLQLPQFAVGTNYVPQDMLAVVHKGEAIIPAAYNPANNGSSGSDALVAEVQALRQEIAAMRATNEVIAKAATNSDKTLTRVTRGGDAMQTQVFL